MQITLRDISHVFPEAYESERGMGPCFIANCRNGHKNPNNMDLEINQATGYCQCHNCGWIGSLMRDFGIDPISRVMSGFFPNAAPTSTVKKAPRSLIRRGGPTWGDPTNPAEQIAAPGQTVLFRDLKDDHVAVEYLRRREFNIEELRNFPDCMALHYCTHGQFKIAEGMGTTGDGACGWRDSEARYSRFRVL